MGNTDYSLAINKLFKINCTALHYTPLNCTKLTYTALSHTVLNCTVLYHCTALYFAAPPHCTVLKCTTNKQIIESHATDKAFRCKPAPGYNLFS